MKFEVNKFLAFTALLAGASVAAAGCSSDDSKLAPGGSNGGEAGESTITPVAGTGNRTSEAGAGGVSEGQGGAVDTAGAAGAKEAQGGASEGGASGASDGGAAGAALVGSCISDVVGEAGASSEFPCQIWTATDVPDCSGEGTNRAGELCQLLDNTGGYRPNVLAAYNECAKALANSCDVPSVSNCALNLIGDGCTQPTTAANCAIIAVSCPGVTLCTGILDLATADGQTAIVGCMDPSNENPYTKAPNLDCDMNLRYCASLPVVAQPTTL